MARTAVLVTECFPMSSVTSVVWKCPRPLSGLDSGGAEDIQGLGLHVSTHGMVVRPTPFAISDVFLKF